MENKLAKMVSAFFDAYPDAKSVISVGEDELFLSCDWSAAQTHAVRNGLPLVTHENSDLITIALGLDNDFEKDEINAVAQDSDVDSINMVKSETEATTIDANDEAETEATTVNAAAETEATAPESPKPSKK